MKMPLSEGFDQYGKLREPKRSRNKPQGESGEEQKPKEKPVSFLESFNGVKVRVALQNGRVVEGTLGTSRYNRYELMVGEMLVMKHSVATIERVGEGGEAE